MEHALLLNQDYTPLKVVSWQRAVSLMFRDSVEVIEEYDDNSLRTVSLTFRLPAVLRLKRRVNMHTRKPRFNKMGVFSRDSFTCQYCGEQPGINKLTIDHVIPKSKGGPKTWENTVTSCQSCNFRKRDRTPDEARMPLLGRKPYRPTSPMFRLNINIPKTPEAWKFYLGDWIKPI